ncbi:hypothetical protein [Thermosynechococcus vestitus]|nr:hypothetical protein [Thermosynechococcus vestitus]
MATHHLRQAAPIADWTAFLALQTNSQGQTVGNGLSTRPPAYFFKG